MPAVYARNLDLDLLRVLIVVGEAGDVTEAAQRLYFDEARSDAPALSIIRDRIVSIAQKHAQGQ